MDAMSTSCSRLKIDDSKPGWKTEPRDRRSRNNEPFGTGAAAPSEKKQEKTNVPAPTPHTTEATTGVLVLSLTVDRKPNSRPSLDMEYRTRGNGNTHPSNLFGPRYSAMLIETFKKTTTIGLRFKRLLLLRCEQSEYRAAGDHVFDDGHAQVLVDDGQRRVRVLWKTAEKTKSSQTRWFLARERDKNGNGARHVETEMNWKREIDR